MAYIRDVKSPSWKPTLKLGHDEENQVNHSQYDRHRDRKTLKGKPSEVSAAQVGDMSGDDYGGDRDDYGGVSCQTQLGGTTFSLLTVEDERLLRAELNRLKQENRELKEKLASTEMFLESLTLRENDDSAIQYNTMQYRFIISFKKLNCGVSGY